MEDKLRKYFDEIKARGLDPERESRIIRELEPDREDHLFDSSMDLSGPKRLYAYNDLETLHDLAVVRLGATSDIRSMDELLARDKQREKDGFPRKIRVGRLIKPGKGGKDKVVVVPTTVEEKFYHDKIRISEEEAGGSGEGEEGEVIGETPVREESGPGSGPGEGGDAPHEIESNAYDLGRLLTEQFELPNLKDKGKKRSLTHFTYDMTDRNRGFGQFLDKKATLRQIVETNITLGNIPDVTRVDPDRFLIAPGDMVYRVLSREIDYESQAMVFFLRDYSGSMSGRPTELVVSQHLLIYGWLYYQYSRRVESRFILHDAEAKEVQDFYTYYNARVAGGTKVSSAYQLVNRIVEQENLVQDYNIYVFHGTDGDDWDTGGREALPELNRMLNYSNRIGITIASRSGTDVKTEVEKYLLASKLLDEKKDYIRLDVMQDSADEPRLIEGIKKLIS